jgi:ABC-type transport system involved in multi-copper enzyme maturation permease subunit
VSDVLIVARHALRESVRRRVFVVVLVLSVAFLGLYAWGASVLFDEVSGFEDVNGVDVETATVAGASLLGLGMFATLFLGTVLAVFLTLGAVRGDAERGLLQPLIVRPLGRPSYLAGRFLAAATVSGTYVVVIFLLLAAITALLGWTPDRVVSPALRLGAAALLISAFALLGSVLFSTTANGIGVFMVFGAGLTAGLLGQIGDALASDTLERIGEIAAWLLPFEMLYQDGLRELTADIGGAAGVIVELGLFGGANEAGALMWPYAIAYLAALGALATWGFQRRDL